MTPQLMDLPTLYKGDWHSAIHFTLTASVNGAAYAAIDLTGCTPLVQLRRNGRLYHEFTCTTPTAGGTFSIVPGLLDIPAGTYDFDVQIEHASGMIRTYLKGSCIVEQDVSAPA